jgi:hypothetical protein
MLNSGEARKDPQRWAEEERFHFNGDVLIRNCTFIISVIGMQDIMPHLVFLFPQEQADQK